NFVRTMMSLSKRCAKQGTTITVVDDQFGRLTFTDDMAAGIFHLLDTHAPYGTYNLTGSGRIASWFEIAREVFDLACGNGDAGMPVTTEEYYAASANPVSSRPVHSALSLDKIRTAGYYPSDWKDQLRLYVRDSANVG
ncbi:MAG: sugar nucleotide-binding protein, partial [Coriobacteriales bacterium]